MWVKSTGNPRRLTSKDIHLLNIEGYICFIFFFYEKAQYYINHVFKIIAMYVVTLSLIPYWVTIARAILVASFMSLDAPEGWWNKKKILQSCHVEPTGSVKKIKPCYFTYPDRIEQIFHSNKNKGPWNENEITMIPIISNCIFGKKELQDRRRLKLKIP